MSDPSSPRQRDKELRHLLWIAGGAMLGALLCVLLTVLYFAQALDLNPTARDLQRAVAQQSPESPDKTTASEPPPEEVSGPLCSAHFYFQTAEEEPVVGTVTQSPENGKTPSLGRAPPMRISSEQLVPRLPCNEPYRLSFKPRGHDSGWQTYEVVVIPEQDTYFIEVGGAQLSPTCPLRMVFELSDGTPLAGSARLAHDIEGRVWLPLDAQGAVEFPAAPCTSDVGGWLVSEQHGKHRFRLQREPADQRELRWVLGRQAIVRLVDSHGELVAEAEIRDEGVELLEPSVYRLTANRPTARFRVFRPSLVAGEAEVPPDQEAVQFTVHTVELDGETHDVELSDLREVSVHLLCDGCEGPVACGLTACAGRTPDWLCSCPAEDTPLWLYGESEEVNDKLMAVVPSEVDHLELDARDARASLHLHITTQPDRRAGPIRLERLASHGAPMEWLGSHRRQLRSPWSVEGLLPGPWLLTWTILMRTEAGEWASETHQLEVELEPGERRELGDLAEL